MTKNLNLSCVDRTPSTTFPVHITDGHGPWYQGGNNLGIKKLLSIKETQYLEYWDSKTQVIFCFLLFLILLLLFSLDNKLMSFIYDFIKNFLKGHLKRFLTLHHTGHQGPQGPLVERHKLKTKKSLLDTPETIKRIKMTRINRTT